MNRTSPARREVLCWNQHCRQVLPTVLTEKQVRCKQAGFGIGIPQGREIQNLSVFSTATSSTYVTVLVLHWYSSMSSSKPNQPALVRHSNDSDQS